MPVSRVWCRRQALGARAAAICCALWLAFDAHMAFAQVQPESPAERRIVLTETGAVELALENNLALKAALLDELIEAEGIREALGTYDPTFFANSNYGRREVLFASNFPLNPSDPFSPTVTRIISQTSDVAELAFGARGVFETGLSYELTFRNDYSFQQRPGGLNPIWNSNASLTLTQPLLARAWSSYIDAPVEIARIGRESAREQYRARVRDTIRDVQQAYYDYVFAIADLEVKRQSRELAAKQLEVTVVRVETGALAPVERTASESALAGRQADLVSAEAEVVQAEDRLRRKILSFRNAEDWTVALVPAERPGPPSGELLPLTDILQLAETAEPDLLRSQLLVAQQGVRVRRAKGETGPKLDLVGTGGLTGLNDDPFQSTSDAFDRSAGAASWSVGLNYEIPIGDRAARGRLAAEELRLTKAHIELEDRRTEVQFQIRLAYRAVHVAARSVEAREKAVRLSEAELDNERTRLDLGTRTTFEVFQVEEQLAQRRTELIRAQLDHRLALLDLCQRSGLSLAAVLAKVAAEPPK